MTSRGTLARELGLIGLTATGVCSMMGAAINIIPLMVQRSVPAIGPHVLGAYLVGAIPAVLAALCFAILSSAMPRAGGSYIYASRAVHPYVGFVASFSQWFGLSIAVGVVSYVVVFFLRDIAANLGAEGLAAALDGGAVRVTIALAFLWIFVGVNVRGIRLYQRLLVPLMVLMFLGGSVVIVTGVLFDQADFVSAVAARDGVTIVAAPEPPLRVGPLLAAAAILFSSFIGFDSIAQAGGEAKNPNRNLPLAIGLAVGVVGSFYMLFTAAVYKVVPWQYVAERAVAEDLTAPGLLAYVLSPGWAVAIVAGAAVALINDLPAMLLAVSRLMFAWAEDGIFPKWMAAVGRYRTPYAALVASGVVASGTILGSQLAGDFFLGVDILVMSMLVNFGAMAVSVLALPHTNPALAAEVRVVPHRGVQRLVAGAAVIGLLTFLVIHVTADLRADVAAWYFRSTPVWLLVMAGASVIFLWEWRALRRSGVDLAARFRTLPEQ